MSRRCNDAIEQVYFYLDGEMTWFRRMKVRRHLRHCDGCHSSFEFEAHFKEVVRTKGYEEPDPELIDRLRAFLHEHGSDGVEA